MNNKKIPMSLLELIEGLFISQLIFHSVYQKNW